MIKYHLSLDLLLPDEVDEGIVIILRNLISTAMALFGGTVVWTWYRKYNVQE